MGLGNTPRRVTVISLEARKSFAFGLHFMRSGTEAALDMTGATVRFVLAQPAHKGGAVLLTKTASAVDLPRGLLQLELQAAELDLAEAEYPFDVTLVSANGYSTPVMKGVVDLRASVDPDDANVYAGINPSTNLAVYLEQGDVVQVVVDKVDGLYVLVQAEITSFRNEMAAEVEEAAGHALLAQTSASNSQNSASAANTSATNAAASAAAAAASETDAEAAATSAAAASTSANAAVGTAQTAAGQAQTSATNAASSASAAAASQLAAAGAESGAATSAADAATSASNAATSEANAAGSASAAAASAAQAEAVVTGDLDPVVAGKVNDPASQTNNAIEGLIGSTTPAAHIHDDRYYTEAEVDAMIAGTSAPGHTHDDRYFTETEVNAALAGKSNTDHTHTKADVTDFAHTHPASDLTATGTRDNTTFLRGDNTWAVVESGAKVQAAEPTLAEGGFWYDTDDDLPAGLDGTGFRMVRSGKDANKIFTVITYYRTDGTKALDSTLSGGTSPSYTTRVVREYAGDGTTVLLTTTYTLSYDGDGDLTSEVFA